MCERKETSPLEKEINASKDNSTRDHEVKLLLAKIKASPLSLSLSLSLATFFSSDNATMIYTVRIFLFARQSGATQVMAPAWRV